MITFAFWFWISIACLFGSLAISSFISRKDFSKIKSEIDNPRIFLTSNGAFVLPGPFIEIFTSFYNISRATLIIGGVGSIVSGVAALATLCL